MTLTEDQLRAAFDREWPGRDWNQDCQAAVSHAAEYTTGKATFYLTAKEAFEGSEIVSRNPAKATLNVVHFWAIGPDWHTGFQLAGDRIFMATKHADGSFGTNLGVTTAAAYAAATGAPYRGFARTGGVNRVQVAQPRPTTGGSAKVRLVGAYLNSENLGRKTKAAQDGIVDQTGTIVQVYWWLCQEWGIRHGMYPCPPFKHDGKVAEAGGQTRKCEDAIYKLARDAQK